MRVDEFEIEGDPMERKKKSGLWEALLSKYFGRGGKQHTIGSLLSTENQRLSWEDPTPYELFSIFITPYMLNQVALFTNIKADRWWRDPSKKKTKGTRPWEDTDGAGIGAWIGLRLLMGLGQAVTYQKYWNTSYTGAIYVAIQSAMTVRRFEQIRRFLKINDPRSEPKEIGSEKDFWRKIEPFVQGFFKILHPWEPRLYRWSTEASSSQLTHA